MERRTGSLQQRLLNSQQYVVYAASLTYVLFVLLVTLANPAGPVLQTFLAPRFGLAALLLLTSLLVWAEPQRLRQIYLLTYVGCLLTLVFEIPRVLSADQNLLQLFLWQSVNVPISFLILGSRWGLGANVLTLLTLLGSLTLHGPFSMAQLADWLTVSLTLTITTYVSYLIMTFIEGNLLTHEQDQGRLRAARQDALTMVYGRGAIEEELERAMNHSRQHNTPMSVIVTDIDHFKSVNDLYGHATGDDVLRAVAKRLRRAVGSGGGMVGRWGGEEFIVLLPGLAKPEALVVAERLRREISGQPLADLEITASFGVASYRGANDTADQLFGRADQAMYEAKNLGRNAVR
ncbi:GGDEF domain-containing protein [Deinococcus radiopugnans]|uniref:Diguanylate cyclase (GGDEF)-like protein n=1 Tax=Deinococcus radiopugnans ATCC 19172 TaxID=585398 RepID=A0A5C4Y9B8_9DEIO|nr:GGDEF domain-containing protein [Deinococcus radiopugnans]MBB6015761.1 diguanylate cyclase (GGDEF)-like protein [Deinococcus radiopugnans ATCC 19172]TNM72555.1 GGDEF domain-containing protein [Deinococcus radiopugnans ATCC 19172]